MATLNLTRLKQRLVKALTPWFLGCEQDALIEAIKTGGEETLLAVDVDTAALQAQFTNLYSNNGANSIGIADAGGYYPGTTVEAALQQVGAATVGGPFQPADGDLTAIAAVAGTNTYIKRTGVNTWSSLTPTQVKTDLALVKADVGLGNVDNTSDANKPVSTAQAAADLLKMDKAAATATSLVYSTTAAAGFMWDHRDNAAKQSMWYSTGGNALLWDNTFGPRLTINMSTGDMQTAGRIGVYAPNVSENLDGLIGVGGSFVTAASNSVRGIRVDTDAPLGAGFGYANFDAAGSTSGGNAVDHQIGFQARPFHNGSGVMARLEGFGSLLTTNGPVQNAYGYHMFDTTGTGTVTTQFGIFIDSLAKGASNYGIWVNGNNPSVFGGQIWPKTTNAIALGDSTLQWSVIHTALVYNNNLQILSTRKTGWTASTGTATRGAFATGSVTLVQLAEQVKALKDDLIAHGLIGA